MTKSVKFWLSLSSLFFLSLWYLNDILLPFIAGLLIAYFLDPVADKLEEEGVSRSIAAGIIILLSILVMASCLFFIVPTIISQAIDLAQSLPGIVEKLHQTATPYLDQFRNNITQEDIQNLKSSVGSVSNSLLSISKGVAGQIWSGSMIVINFLTLLVITPVVAFYTLRDWDILVGKINDLIPKKNADEVRSVFTQIDTTISAFIRGQSIVCLTLSAFYALALLMVGLQYGIAIGIAAGILSFIPFIGSGIGFILGGAVAFASGDQTLLLLTFGVFGAGQIIEGYVLTPYLVGDKVRLHPVIVILAVIAFTSIFGFIGTLVAVPTAAIAGVLVRYAISKYRQSTLFGEESLKEMIYDDLAAIIANDKTSYMHHEARPSDQKKPSEVDGGSIFFTPRQIAQRLMTQIR